MAGAGTTTQVGGLDSGGGGGAGGLLAANNLSDVLSAATSRANLGFSALTDYVTLTGTQTLTNKTLTSPTVTSLTATGTTTITGTTAINPTGVSALTIGNSAGSTAINLISRQSPTSTVYTTSTNTVIEDFALYTKSTSGTPAAGYGAKLNFYGDSNGNTDRNFGYLGLAWTTATDASRTAYAEFRLVNNASLIQTVDIVPGGLNIYGTTSGVISVRAAAAAGTWTFTLPTTDGNANEFLQTNGSGVSTWAVVTDALLSTSDITTNDVSTTKHGFAPKAPNDATKYLDGTGAYSVPASGGGGGSTIAKYKTANESVASSTTLQDDDHLFFAIGANETWAFMMSFSCAANGSGGVKYAFTVPAGATARGRIVSTSNPFTTADVDLTTGGGSTTAHSNTVSNIVFGNVVNSSTAGDVKFQFAQNASNAANTTIGINSQIIAWKVS